MWPGPLSGLSFTVQVRSACESFSFLPEFLPPGPDPGSLSHDARHAGWGLRVVGTEGPGLGITGARGTIGGRWVAEWTRKLACGPLTHWCHCEGPQLLASPSSGV